MLKTWGCSIFPSINARDLGGSTPPKPKIHNLTCNWMNWLTLSSPEFCSPLLTSAGARAPWLFFVSTPAAGRQRIVLAARTRSDPLGPLGDPKDTREAPSRSLKNRRRLEISHAWGVQTSCHKDFPPRFCGLKVKDLIQPNPPYSPRLDCSGLPKRRRGRTRFRAGPSHAKVIRGPGYPKSPKP